jgi:hypothetical protein
MIKVGDRFIPKDNFRSRYNISEAVKFVTLVKQDSGHREIEFGDGEKVVGFIDLENEFYPYRETLIQSNSTERLLGRKVFARYVSYNTYMNYGHNLIKNIQEIQTLKIEGIFDNHSEPMFHIDGGDEYGYLIIPRQFIIELYELT